MAGGMVGSPGSWRVAAGSQLLALGAWCLETTHLMTLGAAPLEYSFRKLHSLDDALVSSSTSPSTPSTMARILALIALVVAAVVTQADATAKCQCLFQDNSHCCVYFDGSVTVDCTKECKVALRNKDEKPCNGGGKWTNVSTWNAKFREPCKGATTGM